MNAHRPDRVVRVLTILVSVAFYVTIVAGVLLLLATPLFKLFAGESREWTWDLPVPVTVQDSATVVTRWGPAQLELDDVRGDLELPITMLPWPLLTVLWTYRALQLVLTLVALHHLRRICQRVRDGAPFDAHNAVRLRSLGLLVFGLAVFSGLAEFVTSLAVKKGLASGTIAIPTGLHINAPVVIVALVLVALAEVFRRGAELETEQSLVV
jgi:hypothetical protein